MVSQDFSQNIIAVHSKKGAEWLHRLPNIIAECERRWSLRAMPPFAPLSYNYAAPAVRADGAEVVLKLGVPHYEFQTEMEALRLYDGKGIAKLFDSDFDMGVIILERLKPGELLSSIEDDEQATSIAAQIMAQLRQPAPSEHDFPTVEKWAEGLQRLRKQFDGGTGPLPAHLVETAETLFEELLDSMGSPTLLHGDLHHYNILSAEREPWLAIDPKGVIGEAEYEIGAFLRNRLRNQANPQEILKRRIEIFADILGFDKQRILAWGMAQSVLSLVWSIEDHGGITEGSESMICANALTRLL